MSHCGVKVSPTKKEPVPTLVMALGPSMIWLLRNSLDEGTSLLSWSVTRFSLGEQRGEFRSMAMSVRRRARVWRVG